MLTGSVTIGRIFGATVRLHWSALIVALLLGLGLSRDVGVVVAAVGVLSFFVAILAHELAHAAVARRFGIGTASIDLWGLGGFANLERVPQSPRAEGWIAAAGPVGNGILGGLAVLAAWLLQEAGAAYDVRVSVAWFAVVNLGLAAFNILPGAPLDGGRVLRAIRWARHGNRYRAMRESAIAGTILGWGLVGVGVSLMFNGHPGIWVAASGLFIVVSARLDTLAAIVGERIGAAKVTDYTWFGVAEAGPDTDVDSMLWQRSRLGGAGAVAVRGDGGRLDGLVLEDQMWAVPAELRASTMLTQVMAPFDRLPRAHVDDELATVLPAVNPLRPVITVWRGDRLLGVIPPKVVKERVRAVLEFVQPPSADRR